MLRKWAMFIMLAGILGAIANVLAAGLCAQFSQRPICTLANARNVALDMIMKHPNPVQPIWPEFSRSGRGVTIAGRYASPEDELDAGTMIVVNLSVGWPLRTMTLQTAYSGKWTEPGPRMELFATPGPGGNFITRELPLTVIWPNFAINTLFYAALVLLLLVPLAARRFTRRLRHQCPACGYPIGTSPVCTECGRPVRVSRRGNAGRIMR